MIQDHLTLNKDWMNEKSRKEREQNESFERELRPWNAPALIDEMEFLPKSQESEKHKKEKGNEKRECKKSSRRKERLEKTLSLRALSPFP